MSNFSLFRIKYSGSTSIVLFGGVKIWLVNNRII